MKRLISTVIALLLMLTLAVPVFAEDSAEQSLLILGDSISNGYGVDKDSRYGEVLNGRLGFKYTNRSVDGATSSDLLNKYLTIPLYQNACKSADYIIFTIGGNDLIASVLKIASAYSGKSFTSVESAASYLSNRSPAELEGILNAPATKTELASMLATVEKNLTAIFAKFKELNENTKVIILTQYNPMNGESSLDYIDAALDPLFQQFNVVVNKCADDAGAYVVDIYTAFKGQGAALTRILSGDIHPNGEGHRLIAEKLYELFDEKLLSAETEAPTVTEAPNETDAPTESEVLTETKAPTETATFTETEKATDTVKPSDTATVTSEPIAEKGCGGVAVALQFIAILAAGFVTVTVIKKK